MFRREDCEGVCVCVCVCYYDTVMLGKEGGWTCKQLYMYSANNVIN